MLYLKLIISFLLIIAPLSLLANNLDEAKEAYLYGDYNKAVRICLESLDKGETAEALYFTGLSFFKLHEYAKARYKFKRLLSNFKNSYFFDAAIVKLVDTYFLNTELDKAKSLYKSVLQKYPHLEYKSLIYLRLAQVSAKQGNWSDKNRYARLVINKYSDSLESKLAKRIIRRGNFFTVQVGAFSKKKNAINFANKLKKDFPVYVVSETEEDITLHKVRIGKYVTKERSERIHKKLSEQGYPARIYP